MNRLAFGEFHSKHFGPEQKAYWHSVLQQQQQQQDQQEFYGYHHYEIGQDTEQNQEQDEENYEKQLSKEAIEIFQFSEAYRKEKEAERIEQEKNDTEGMQDWQYDESTVLCSGGMEAPTTSLVLTQPKSRNEKIRIQEDLLNSAYLSDCKSSNNQEPVVLWPVLPFRM
ncbi:hypothetical protein [Parasitella parasitica]|uniref:Uncharacterized protein n=1 Tax=Parasitella parasitica TaxID=35722 RepID=A0A0B7MX87_9FUNG|nr:hypothetical protein [Parasitella parasitica]